MCIVTVMLAAFGGREPRDWPIANESRADSLGVLFWNLENFFDYRNDSTSVSDAEFSSRGERRWTKKRFQAKCNAIAKGVLWVAGQKGMLPDVIGVAEVENAYVLKCLIHHTIFSKLDYTIVHFESPDPRGIDVALLYRSRRLTLTRAGPCHLYDTTGATMRTRDILLAQFAAPGGDTIAFLVNHHPSKYGGKAASEARRRVAVERLRFLADSLQRAGMGRVVAMGDFNDTPANPVYRTLEPVLVNLGWSLHKAGAGTIKYQGSWELIDMFFVSPALLRPESSLPAAAGKRTPPAPMMEIMYIPFLQVRDKTFAGTKPLRTYSGPRYLGGVSDHCPIWLTIPENLLYLRD